MTRLRLLVLLCAACGPAAATGPQVFRHIFVGLIVYPAERATWTLSGDGTAARLEISCQSGQAKPSTGIRLDGKEQDEGYWLPPAIARYAGTRTGDRFQFAAEGEPSAGKGLCADWPARFELNCARADVQVLPAGARLIAGHKNDDDTRTPSRWEPGTRKSVSALRCQVTEDPKAPEWPLRDVTHHAPLLFAPAGVEWADENSDMIVQEGAYRFFTVRSERRSPRRRRRGIRSPARRRAKAGARCRRSPRLAARP
jgi:hypothetical protein